MQSFCVISASYLWTKTLIGDLLACFVDAAIDVHFVDHHADPARTCKEWVETASKACDRNHDRYSAYTDRKHALTRVDAILITISTGGLIAITNDLKILERHGINTIAGELLGARDWSISIRNILVFANFAEDIRKLYPQVLVANYTKPISTLTATLAQLTDNPVSGFFHAFFEIKDVIQKLSSIGCMSRSPPCRAGLLMNQRKAAKQALT